MQFIYILPGREGSAHDTRVLHDVISMRNGLKVPQGYYYLCDVGYPNGEGFLTPYRNQRYHLNEWRQGHQPSTPAEIFNMRHSTTGNAIERIFGLLKIRWAILRTSTWYPIKTQCRIINACCLLYNYIRKNMSIDPMESRIENFLATEGGSQSVAEIDEQITSLENSSEWVAFRDNLANQMWQQFRH
uniref:DDE Tnp4 domain-containing protein n=1 Tax=Nelumbo nucifera TaxID=4432 RepID=A0A822ZTS0_NELNU|nr:TPA_asm: hypothetical protein HUJ06_016636 [Nelumbo nucifera]